MLGHSICICPAAVDTAKQVSKVVPICIPVNNIGKFLMLCALANLWYYLSFTCESSWTACSGSALHLFSISMVIQLNTFFIGLLAN